MNVITIAGNLGRDAELRYLPKGDAVLNFSVADNQGGKDKPTIWWNCSLWGKSADALAQYLTKGQTVTVAGSVSEREWTDKEGNARKSMEVRVSEIALQGGKQHESAPQREPAKREAPQADPFADQDIPFANPYRGKLSYVV
jgi:single-strand DNA-binding protein